MSDIDLFERQLSSETIYRGRIISVYNDEVQLPNGDKAHREYVDHVGGAAILPLDADGNVLLVRQFRYPYRSVIYEIPAGKLEKGEDPLVTAKRELEEETGYVADSMRPYGVFYPSPGYTDERLFLYVAEGLHKTAAHLDEDEFVDVYRFPLATVLQMVRSNEIKDGKTCYTVMRYALENGLTL